MAQKINPQVLHEIHTSSELTQAGLKALLDPTTTSFQDARMWLRRAARHLSKAADLLLPPTYLDLLREAGEAPSTEVNHAQD